MQDNDLNDDVDTAAEPLRTETAADSPELAAHDRLADLEEQLAATRQEVLYAQAETQNVRRRLEKEASDARAYAATAFARDVLSVADNLGRALDAIGPELRADERFRGLVGGLEATGRELTTILERNGIARIESAGQPLDPNRHQAMMEVPSDQPPGTVVAEMQAGYTIRDRLLRPAMVTVARAPD